ncbi:L,D-transpeptidase family protein [Brumimicrobium sp.]|uniref:L,D-transpeptidase family protein n=1 Tax=Brumimicrobium sp. TaxID=2029867 RepID=UPI003A9296B8
MNSKILTVYVVFFSGLFLSGCNSNFEFNDNESKIENKIDQSTALIDESMIQAMKIDKNAKKWAIDLYNLNKNHAFWIKSESISSDQALFFAYVNSDTALNIPFGYFSTPSYKNETTLFEKEVITALRCAEFLNLKDTSIFNHQKNTANISQRVSAEHFIDFFNAFDNPSWIAHLLNFKENNKHLVKMHLAMNKFTKKYGIETNTNSEIPTDLKDSLAVFHFISQQLMKRNFIEDTTLKQDELVEQLRQYQFLNGLNTDGAIGRNTIGALTETNYSRYLKGVLSIDKLRGFPDSLIGKKRIVINIPSYLLHLYIDDQIVNTSKVIVGTQKNQTPLFTATMQYFVVNPYWNVPYSIASKEILPHLKKDSSYLRRNNYTLLDRNKNILIADSINWKNISPSNFPYFVRQEPGPRNSLGLVKLMFPNDHAIYIHDTPSKSLFSRDERTFSHGCIRTEHPFKLAHDILASENHKYIDSVEHYLTLPKETYLILGEKFPVTIVYHTAGVNDSTQEVQFYKDIYKKEEEINQLFQSTPKEN